MPDRKMLFWIDFEATGLLEDPVSPTFLEAAWTVTDPAGAQLTPLAQAFTALRPGVGGGSVLPELTEHADGVPVGYWDHADYPVDAVRKMHEENGLTTEHALVQNEQADRILWSWDELERLILDDLRTAGFYELDAREAQLAGAGVAHYEQRFLPEAMPRIFNDQRLHYRTHDVSQILGGLRTALPAELDFPGDADHLINAMRPEEIGLDRALAGRIAMWSGLSLSVMRYDAADRNGWDADDERIIPNWALLERDNHRAAVGVARALMAHRLLPEVHRLFATSAA